MRRIILALAAATAVVVLVVVMVRRSRDRDAAPDQDAAGERSGRSRDLRGSATESAQGFTGERLDQDDDPAGDEILEGQVIDENEQPVAGARVVLSSLPAREAVSEADGGFEFRDLIARSYLLEARLGDAAAGPVSTRLTVRSEPVILRLRQAARVEVEVVDSRGAPVAGALVELRNVGVIQETSNSAGAAALRGVNPGTHVLKVAAAGFASVWELVVVSGAPGEVVEKIVQLRDGVAVAGTVVDPAGRPVEGARVTAETATSIWDPADSRLDASVTDAKGRWQLTGLARMTFRFRAFHPALAPGFSEPIQLTDGTGRGDILIRLELGGRLAGRVIDTAGLPVAGARVQAASEDARSGPVRRAHSDADGRFALDGLPRTRVHMIAVSENATSEMAAFDLAEQPQREDLKLQLSLTGVIAGRVVTTAGEEVREAQVIATPFASEVLGEGVEQRLRGLTSDVADQAGRFALAGLAPGRYRVRAIRPGSSVELLSMKPGEVIASPSTDVKVVVDDLTSMSGQVRFRKGGEPKLFQVRLGSAAPRSFADTAGKFRIDEVPAGKQFLTISGEELVINHRDDITLAPGRDNDLGTIEVDRGRRIRGRVTTGGAGVGGAEVVIGPDLMGDGWSLIPFKPRVGTKQTVTGADGSFIIAGVGPQDQVLVAERDGLGRSAAVEIGTGTADLTIDLPVQPYGALTGHLRVNGKAPPNGVVFLRPTTAANLSFVVVPGTDGRYQFDRLAPGSYMAFGILESKGGDASEAGSGRKVTIRSGVTETVDFDVTKGNIQVIVRLSSPGDSVHYGYGVLARLVGQVPVRLPTTITEARRFLTDSGGGDIHEGFIVSDRQVTFAGLSPGAFCACVAPLPGPPDDPDVMAKMQSDIVNHPIYCNPPIDIAASPPSQTIVVEVQPAP